MTRFASAKRVFFVGSESKAEITASLLSLTSLNVLISLNSLLSPMPQKSPTFWAGLKYTKG